jgi:protein tyrosine phosphatase (PTP) superfamily phosphohydrolase (DUF442 family)
MSLVATMPALLRTLALVLAVTCGTRALAAEAMPAFAAPNVVEINPRLVTSGQPSAAMLATLAAQGFAADIYLAPLTLPDAVHDEPAIVARQGLVFVNIPIAFGDPSAQDFDAFVAALAPLQGRKVLVHCEVNLRASSMVFLYRVIVGKEDPQRAYESVAKVWSPNAKWKRFIVATLGQHGIRFEPY